MSLSLDPTASDPREVAHIYPEEFRIRYVPKNEKNPDGTENEAKQILVPVEMVTWAKKGQHIMTGQKTAMRISQARKDKQIWAALEPHYNAWKAGQAAPVDGTPLAAWPGLTKESADRLKLMRVYSVEDVAKMTDADINAYGMGGLEMRRNAIAFVESSRDKSFIRAEIASQLGEKDAEIAELRRQLAEKETTPVRRGRPPKTEAA